MKWVEGNRILDPEELEVFSEMNFRGEDYARITEQRLMYGLRIGPASRLFDAVQDLIRGKMIGIHFFPFLFSSSHIHYLFLVFPFLLRVCGIA